jgi:hypothetical protein
MEVSGKLYNPAAITPPSPGKIAHPPGTQWIGSWEGPKPAWTLWIREES